MTALDAIRAIRDSNLSAAEKMLLVALVTRADASGVAWPGIDTLSGDAGLSESTTRRALRKLRDAGLVTWTEGGVDGRSSNRYRVTVEGCRGETPGVSSGLPTGVTVKPQGVHGETPGVSGRHPRGVMVKPDLSIELSIELPREEESAPAALACPLEGEEQTGEEPESGESAKATGSAAIARDVLAYWSTHPGLSKRTRRFGDKELRAVRARLGEGYTAEQLKLCVDGCSKSTFHTEAGHTAASLIFRDAAHVDRFLSFGMGEVDPNRDVKRARPNDIVQRHPDAPETFRKTKVAS